MNNFNKVKGYQKSSAFHKHGKHSGTKSIAIIQDKWKEESRKKRDSLKEMYPSVKSLFASLV